MTVTPQDDVISPILDGLIEVGQQIDGINYFYKEPPDRTPEDNTVLLPLKQYEIVDYYSGKVTAKFTFDVIHVFRRRRLDEVMADIQKYLSAWLTVLTAWDNITLNDRVDKIDLKEAKITQYQPDGETLMIALVHTVEVWYTYSIPVFNPVS